MMTDPDPQLRDPTQNPNPNRTTPEPQHCQHLDSQSPKTLTLQFHHLHPDTTDSDTLMEDPTPIHLQNLDDPETDPPLAPSPGNAPVAAPIGRRVPKRKKLGPKRTAQERKSREKLRVLVETLKPVPFVPAKALDFTRHQTLLQRLGLWDFVHIELDSSIRGDLLAQLIASYSSALRCSYVNGVRIMVNRADLGRALKLPVKKSAIAVAVAEDVVESQDLAESIAFVEELVSNWMLLHGDPYIMPPEVLGSTKLIKEGHLEKVDWAGLIWNMVDKELKAPQLGNCYYASHLQHLIKTQHEELLREAPTAEVEAKDEEEEEEEEGDENEAEEVDGSGDVKMGGVEDSRGHELEEHNISRGHELEEHNIELSLGQDSVEKVREEKGQVGGEQMMDFEQSKEGEPGLWLLDPKNNMGEPFLRPCHLSDVKGLDCEEKNDEEAEEEQEQEQEEEQEEEEEEVEEDDDDAADDNEHEGVFHLSPKCVPLEGMPSGTVSLMPQMPFNSGIDLRDNPVGDFLSSRDDPQMISGASLFGNGQKRERELGLDNHNSLHSLNGSHKRLRSDSPWNAKPIDFEMCMDHIEHWVGKARMMYATKEQACEESTMNQQLLLDELQKRDNMIEHLHKAKMDENHRRQMEVYRFEKEIYMTKSLVEGYRKALKETQKAFAEYRARCPQADEPLYKEVPGSGGLVLSVMELEKERLKQQQEERMKVLVIENKLREFEGVWIGKLEDHMNRVQSLGNKLLTIEDQVKLLNEVNAKCKVSDLPERAPSEGENAHPAECVPSERQTAHPPESAPSEGHTAHPPESAPTEGQTAHPPESASSEGHTAHPPESAPTEGPTAHPPESAPSEGHTAHPPESAPTEGQAAHPPEAAPTEGQTAYPPESAPTEGQTA